MPKSFVMLMVCLFITVSALPAMADYFVITDPGTPPSNASTQILPDGRLQQTWTTSFTQEYSVRLEWISDYSGGGSFSYHENRDDISYQNNYIIGFAAKADDGSAISPAVDYRFTGGVTLSTTFSSLDGTYFSANSYISVNNKLSNVSPYPGGWLSISSGTDAYDNNGSLSSISPSSNYLDMDLTFNSLVDFRDNQARDSIHSEASFREYFGLGDSDPLSFTEYVTVTGTATMTATFELDSGESPGPEPGATPEPGTLLLFGSAAGLALWRKHRRKK